MKIKQIKLKKIILGMIGLVAMQIPANVLEAGDYHLDDIFAPFFLFGGVAVGGAATVGLGVAGLGTLMGTCLLGRCNYLSIKEMAKGNPLGIVVPALTIYGVKKTCDWIGNNLDSIQERIEWHRNVAKESVNNEMFYRGAIMIPTIVGAMAAGVLLLSPFAMLYGK